MTKVYYVEIVDQCDFDRLFGTGIFATTKGANDFIEDARKRFYERDGITEATPSRYNGFSASIIDYELGA